MDFMSIAQELKAKRQDILQLAARHGATQVRIFGSVARAEAGPDSDVDFLVKLAPERSLLDHVALWQDLFDFAFNMRLNVQYLSHGKTKKNR
jgi:predicted nucleotidyltransferase